MNAYDNMTNLEAREFCKNVANNTWLYKLSEIERLKEIARAAQIEQQAMPGAEKATLVECILILCKYDIGSQGEDHALATGLMVRKLAKQGYLVEKDWGIGKHKADVIMSKYNDKRFILEQIVIETETDDSVKSQDFRDQSKEFKKYRDSGENVKTFLVLTKLPEKLKEIDGVCDFDEIYHSVSGKDVHRV